MSVQARYGQSIKLPEMGDPLMPTEDKQSADVTPQETTPGEQPSVPEVDRPEVDRTEVDRLRADLASASAEADKWKSLSRKHEDRAKASTPPTEVEAAIAAARVEAAEQVKAESVKRVAAAEARASLATLGGDAGALAEWLDTSRLVDAGDVSATKLAALVEAVRPLMAPGGGMPPISQGVALTGVDTQRTRDDLRGKSAEWIESERKAGNLNRLLGLENN